MGYTVNAIGGSISTYFFNSEPLPAQCVLVIGAVCYFFCFLYIIKSHS